MGVQRLYCPEFSSRPHYSLLGTPWYNECLLNVYCVTNIVIRQNCEQKQT